jgi:hypothetical protein
MVMLNHDKTIKHSAFKKPKKHWLTMGKMLVSIKNKNKMFKQLKVNAYRSLQQRYKKYENKLSNLLKMVEKRYYNNQLNINTNNLSKIWKTLNGAINRTK